MNKDDLLLSEAYSQVYNEGIWDRLKGQASGIGAGLKQGAQNLTGKVAGAFGNEVKSSGETMGGSYANAQQTSLVNSFIKKAQKEIADFNNDISKMGVNPNDEQFPEIKSQLDSVNNLIAFLQNPQGTPPSASTNQPATQPAEPTAPAATQPAAPEPKASEKAQLAASTPSGTGPLTVQNKTLATPQQATGVVSGIPKNTQTTATPGGTFNTSFSMANNQQPKQVNQLPKEQPSQKVSSVSDVVKNQGIQDAEIVGGEETQQNSPTQHYADTLAQGDGKKTEASQSPNGSTASLNGVNYEKNQEGKWLRLDSKGGVQSIAAGKDIPELEKQAAAQKSGTLKTANQIGAQGGNKTKVNEAFRFWRKF